MTTRKFLYFNGYYYKKKYCYHYFFIGTTFITKILLCSVPFTFSILWWWILTGCPIEKKFFSNVAISEKSNGGIWNWDFSTGTPCILSKVPHYWCISNQFFILNPKMPPEKYYNKQNWLSSIWNDVFIRKEKKSWNHGAPLFGWALQVHKYTFASKISHLRGL